MCAQKTIYVCMYENDCLRKWSKYHPRSIDIAYGGGMGKDQREKCAVITQKWQEPKDKFSK